MRARITFSKYGPLRYIGHLDLNTLWERAARRAGLPLAYSQGFHPQAKINFAAPLPLGFSSRAEMMDIRLQFDVDLNGLADRLQAALPAGIDVLRVEQVEEAAGSLPSQVRASEYEVTPAEEVDQAALEQRIRSLLEAEALPRERRGKAYDLRPLIEELSLLTGPGQEGHRENKIFMRLAAREGATGRPEEVLNALGLPTEGARIERTRLVFKG